MKSVELFKRTFLAAIPIAFISAQVAMNFRDDMTQLTEWFITSPIFSIITAAATATIGLIFATAGRRGSPLELFTQAIVEPVATIYAGASGGILGWIYGISIVGAFVSSLPLIVWVSIVLLATLELGTPLVGILVGKYVVSAYNNTINRDVARARVAHLFGYLLLIAAPLILVIYLRV